MGDPVRCHSLLFSGCRGTVHAGLVPFQESDVVRQNQKIGSLEVAGLRLLDGLLGIAQAFQDKLASAQNEVKTGPPVHAGMKGYAGHCKV